MAKRTVQVMVDQWGNSPGFLKGATIEINDDDPKEMTYSTGEGAPKAFVGDVDWALENGVVVLLEDGKPQPGPIAGRLPVGDEAAIDRGAPSDPRVVPVASGSAENADPTMAPNPSPDASDEASDDDLTPAQKAARTRAANAARAE